MHHQADNKAAWGTFDYALRFSVRFSISAPLSLFDVALDFLEPLDRLILPLAELGQLAEITR